MSTVASAPVLPLLGAVVGLIKSGWDLDGDLGAVFGLVSSGGLVVVVFVGADSCLGFEVVAGCHRKNSCKRVLTTSGHSIMTMWLPSSMIFRNPSNRIYKKVNTVNMFVHNKICGQGPLKLAQKPQEESQINNYKALSLERKMIVPLPYVGPLVLVQTCRTCREPAEQALWFQHGKPRHPPASTVHSSWTVERRKTHWRHCSL